MEVFRPFEHDIVRLMAISALGEATVERILTEATLVDYEYSGCGYFVTVSHPALPEARQVLTNPLVIGTSGDVVAGYLVFLQDKQLMLECYTAGATEVPPHFRACNVQITAT